MARNERDNKLEHEYGEKITIGTIPILKSLLVNWTPLAKECYKRGCNCLGCNLVPIENLDSLHRCVIKNYVIGYIRLGNYPKIEENEDGK